LKDLSQYTRSYRPHAKKRMQQRGFKQEDVDLLMDNRNHKEKRHKGGDLLLHFNKEGKKIASKFGTDPRMVIVFSLILNKIRTVMHGYPHHRLKNY
tara:strand:+ start:880 stop:1167 length:288 start_codon:yes stop_codon:yes gene_type:complete